MRENKKSTQKKQGMSDNATRLDKAFARIAATKDGVEVLTWIMHQCGYKSADTVRQLTISGDGKSQSFGDILPNTTIHNAATRGLWLDIRKKLNREARIAIEIEREENEHADDTET